MFRLFSYKLYTSSLRKGAFFFAPDFLFAFFSADDDFVDIFNIYTHRRKN